MRDVGERGDVADVEQRVGGRLDPHELGVRAHGRAHLVGVVDGGGGVLDPPLREHLVDETEGAAVGVVRDDEVVARTQHRTEQAVGGGHARAERPAVGAVLERGEVRLEGTTGGVAGAGVLEAVAHLTDTVLGEGRRRVDRHVDGTGLGVGLVPGMDGAGRETVLVLVCHEDLCPIGLER